MPGTAPKLFHEFDNLLEHRNVLVFVDSQIVRSKFGREPQHQKPLQ